jgi:hypothetical protein
MANASGGFPLVNDNTHRKPDFHLTANAAFATIIMGAAKD